MVYGVTMHRTQILLDDWQHEALKAWAERDGRSISALVREMLRGHLSEAPGRRSLSLSDIEGIGADAGASGREHDRILYRRDKDD